MVVVNIIASIVLFSGTLIYKFIFKRNINLLFLLILVSFLPIISIARNGAYESGDFNIHVYRSIAFYSSLSEGNIMPSWAGELNATYGYPLFIFNYILPYYIISLFHFLGASFITSLKLFLSLGFIFSGIGMYVFTKRIFKNELAAFTSAIFYLFAPYHLIGLHFKVVVGELSAFTFLPFFFLASFKIREDKKITSILLSAVLFAALIASHVFIALVASLILAAYIAFAYLKERKTRLVFKTILALFIGVTMSSYVWLTPFFLSQYTIIQKLKLTFIPLENVYTLFYAPWRMGFLFQGHRGEIANLIGYTQLFVVIYLLFKLTKKVSKKSLVIFWLSVFAALFFCILPISRPLWEAIPFIKAVGQHRLLVLIVLVTSILAGYVAMLTKKTAFVYLLIIITVLYTILNWGHRRVIPTIQDQQLIKELPFSTYKLDTHFYANTRWVDPESPWFRQIPKQRIEIIEGKGTIKEVIHKSTEHEYQVDAQTNLQILENTLYFPGWSAQIGRRAIKIGPSENGLIKMESPKGKYTLSVSYQDIPVLTNLKRVSVLTLAGTLMILAYSGLSYFLQRRK